ncbi:MAG: tetraacyldisaccharide 4'-kinase [Fimbriimonadales bacterium]|nr:tetraacyldisaccharide 4'-kinase [Fimbriimonadales bacterium]
MKLAERRLEQLWQSEPPLWLRGLAGLYALGWRAYEGVYRLGLKRRAQMPVPVIGVGSLWAGGVGKTPITIAIARLLHESGRRVAVLTHGYGGSRYREVTLVDPCEYPDPAEVGDEAAELRLTLPDVPIAVGRWRVRTAQAAIARWSPEVLVLDDGFQHLPLARTLDLVLLPAESLLGNGYCLPAGPLREPPSGLRRAGGIVRVAIRPHPPTFSPACGRGEIDRYPHPQPLSHAVGEGSQLPLFRARERGRGGEGIPTYHAVITPITLLHLCTGERLSLTALQNRPFTLVCGIARPERFVQAAQSLGYTIASVHTFPDHHAYRPDELRFFSDRTVLTTAKDAVKLRPYLPEDCDAYALLLEAQLDERLTQRVLQEHH